MKIKLENGKLSYGEARIIQQDTMKMVKGKWVQDELKAHYKLDKNQAFIYYTDKIRLVFGLQLKGYK